MWIWLQTKTEDLHSSPSSHHPNHDVREDSDPDNGHDERDHEPPVPPERIHPVFNRLRGSQTNHKKGPSSPFILAHVVKWLSVFCSHKFGKLQRCCSVHHQMEKQQEAMCQPLLPAVWNGVIEKRAEGSCGDPLQHRPHAFLWEHNRKNLLKLVTRTAIEI